MDRSGEETLRLGRSAAGLPRQEVSAFKVFSHHETKSHRETAHVRQVSRLRYTAFQKAGAALASSMVRWVMSITTRSFVGSLYQEVPNPPSQPYRPGMDEISSGRSIHV